MFNMHIYSPYKYAYTCRVLLYTSRRHHAHLLLSAARGVHKVHPSRVALRPADRLAPHHSTTEAANNGTRTTGVRKEKQNKPVQSSITLLIIAYYC